MDARWHALKDIGSNVIPNVHERYLIFVAVLSEYDKSKGSLKTFYLRSLRFHAPDKTKSAFTSSRATAHRVRSYQISPFKTSKFVKDLSKCRV